MTSEHIIEVNDKNFDEQVIKKSKQTPVVVDFWADWCSPCMILKPVLEKIAQDYKGKFILAKADTNDNQDKCNKYGVMSIPTIKLFKGGKIVDEFTGAIPKEQIQQWLDKNL